MPRDAKPPNKSSEQRYENLDVVRTSVKKTHSPKALRENLPLIRTYLLCAPSRHSPLGSEAIVSAPHPWQQIHFGSSSGEYR